MKNVFVDDSYLTATANAIRAKNNSTDTYKPSEFANAIASISGGGADLNNISVFVADYSTAEDVITQAGVVDVYLRQITS